MMKRPCFCSTVTRKPPPRSAHGSPAYPVTRGPKRGPSRIEPPKPPIVQRRLVLRRRASGCHTSARTSEPQGSATDGGATRARAAVSFYVVLPLPLRARSSVGERLLHTQEVAGSKPAAPTKKSPGQDECSVRGVVVSWADSASEAVKRQYCVSPRREFRVAKPCRHALSRAAQRRTQVKQDFVKCVSDAEV